MIRLSDITDIRPGHLREDGIHWLRYYRWAAVSCATDVLCAAGQRVEDDGRVPGRVRELLYLMFIYSWKLETRLADRWRRALPSGRA